MKSYLLLIAAFIAVVWAKPRVYKPTFFRPNPRITNGEDAEAGQFPYQVSYQWGILGFNQHLCGGSIISPTWILTAGHCIDGAPALGDHIIVAGITNLNDQNAERQDITVVERIRHPDFPGDVGPNDVGLLKLSTPLEFNDLVQPIKLPQADSEPSGDSILSGWGATGGSILLPIMPEHLQTVTIPILPFTECNEIVESVLEAGEENPLSEASNVCTGPLTGGISACSGDSGGPLAQNDEIIGIVSWGFTPCGSENAPSVYTKVSNFIDWIAAHVDDLP